LSAARNSDAVVPGEVELAALPEKMLTTSHAPGRICPSPRIRVHSFRNRAGIVTET